MREAPPLEVSVKPPRVYPSREALVGRVWRDRWSLYGREVSVLCASLTLYGLLLDELSWVAWGLFGLILSALLGSLGGLITNLRRASLVRMGPLADGELVRKRRMTLWHELLRGKAHRSFELTYRYQLDGEPTPREAKIQLCLCAYEHLKDRERLQVIYDPKRPQRSLPLRLALMRVPH
jgi:hypothetical protein